MADRIVLAAGSGYLGQVLSTWFRDKGWEVVVVARNPGPGGVKWDGESQGPWCKTLEGARAVVNMAGRSVDCRYTPANQRVLVDSRVKPTVAIGRAVAACERPPRVWLNASSATLYRHTYGAPWDESATDFAPDPEAKDAFSLDIIHAWEAALRDAHTPLTRKVALRTAMVLGRGSNSVLPTLCRLAKLGLAGKMGHGRQFMSWIHEVDFARAVEWLVERDLEGPVNLAAPGPLPNAEAMRIIRRVCGAPFGLPASRWMLEVGAFFLRTETELVLKSRRVVPGRLIGSGFQFRFVDFEAAVRDLV